MILTGFFALAGNFSPDSSHPVTLTPHTSTDQFLVRLSQPMNPVEGDSADATATDTKLDGVYDTVDASGTDIRAGGGQRGLLEFNIQGLNPSASLAAVTLAATVSSLQFPGTETGVAGNVYGFAGSGTPTVADANGATQVVGQFLINRLGTISISIAPAYVASLQGKSPYLGLAIDVPGASDRISLSDLLNTVDAVPPRLLVDDSNPLAPIAVNDAYAVSAGTTLTVSGPTVQFGPPTLGYTFDEAGSGNAAAQDDGLTPTAPGIFYGAATRTSHSPAGASPGALDLTASGTNYVSPGIVSKLGSLPALTLTAWVNLQSTPTIGSVLFSQNANFLSAPAGDTGWELRIVTPTGGTLSASDFSLDFEVYKDKGGSASTATYISPPLNAANRWIFLALTYDASGNVAIYEGDTTTSVVSIGGADLAAPLGTDPAPFEIGATAAQTVSNLTPPAWIDDVRLSGMTTLPSQLDPVRIEDLANGVLTNDILGSGQPLTASLVNGPAHGTLTLHSDGTFVYTPARAFVGSDSFTYQAVDGSILSNVGTVSITVDPPSTRPTAVADSYSVNKNVALNVPASQGLLANDSDSDGLPLTAVRVTSPARGTLSLNADGSFTYTPSAGFTGTDSFTYEANNGYLNSFPVNETLTVSNTAPVASNDTYTTTQNSTLTVAAAQGVLVNDVDIDGDPLTAAVFSDPSHGSLSLNADGSFTYIPTNGFSGADSFTYQANDGSLNSNLATVFITVNAITKTNPVITWPSPADITYGTALGATQLDATASVPGTFTYSPTTGTILKVGAGQALSVSFTPTDTTDYNSATATTTINVTTATPVISWPTPADITYGTPLGASQLDATANVPGTFTYTPAAGTVLTAGAGQTLSVAFTPSDSTDFNPAAATAAINVRQAVPTITWPAPADIAYGTALGTAQLDATASVPGTFTYTPTAGTVLAAGNGQTLSVVFTPNDTTDDTSATDSTTLNVKPGSYTLTWPSPASIPYGTALGAAQLDATASIPGTFVFTPPAGTVLHAGAGQVLSVTFQPTSSSFAPQNVTTTLNVTQVTPTLTWPDPANLTYGSALSGTQLDATDSVPGTFTYTPPAGTVLNAGNAQTLTVAFTPTDSQDYSTASATATINVQPGTYTVSWPSPADIIYGTALSTTQLDATASVPGLFSYATPAGMVLHAGLAQSLSATFTPTNPSLAPSQVSTAINVQKATPRLTWPSPASIVYGTPLGGNQLDAASSVPGTFVYTPAAGTILTAGSSQDALGDVHTDRSGRLQRRHRRRDDQRESRHLQGRLAGPRRDCLRHRTRQFAARRHSHHPRHLHVYPRGRHRPPGRHGPDALGDVHADRPGRLSNDGDHHDDPRRHKGAPDRHR